MDESQRGGSASPPITAAPAKPPGTSGTRPDLRVYLDAAATAPLHPAARQALLAALDDGWADPRRLHREGRSARRLLDAAREAMAASLGARTEEVGFTGSHVAAVHAAVAGTVLGRRRVGAGVVHLAVEHSAVLHAAEQFGEGGPAPIGVDRLGRVDVEAFSAGLSMPGVALACLQSANGEVGTVQPVEEIAEAARGAGVPLLVDAAASIGHLDPPVSWGLLTADPQAWGGPAGVGVLAVRAGTRWSRPGPPDEGTEPVPGAPSVPVVLAAAAALQALDADRARRVAAARPDPRRALVEQLRRAAADVPDTEVVGDPEHRLPHVLGFSCLYADGEALLDAFDRAGFAVGSGSACTASTLEPSHVLAAMGVLTHGNLRIGLPVGTRPEEVTEFCRLLPGVVAGVRAQLGAADL